MKTSQKGIDLIKRYEGLHNGNSKSTTLTPMMDPIGIWTEGYGRAMRDDRGVFLKGINNKTIAEARSTIKTKQDAENALREDLKPREVAVLRHLKVKVNQNQFDALVSFVYNVGESNLKASTLLKKINANPKDQSIKNEFSKWSNAGGKKLAGLVRRRKEEAELFFLL